MFLIIELLYMILLYIYIIKNEHFVFLKTNILNSFFLLYNSSYFSRAQYKLRLSFKFNKLNFKKCFNEFILKILNFCLYFLIDRKFIYIII